MKLSLTSKFNVCCCLMNTHIARIYGPCIKISTADYLFTVVCVCVRACGVYGLWVCVCVYVCGVSIMWSDATITLNTYNEEVEEDRKKSNNHKLCILSTHPIYVFRLVSEKKVIISLQITTWLILIRPTECVYRVVRWETLYMLQVSNENKKHVTVTGRDISCAWWRVVAVPDREYGVAQTAPGRKLRHCVVAPSLCESLN